MLIKIKTYVEIKDHVKTFCVIFDNILKVKNVSLENHVFSVVFFARYRIC